MNERGYRALYEHLRLRALNDPHNIVDFPWFRQLRRDLNDLSRLMARDNDLSRPAKRRLMECDWRVFIAAVRRMHVAVTQMAEEPY